MFQCITLLFVVKSAAPYNTSSGGCTRKRVNVDPLTLTELLLCPAGAGRRAVTVVELHKKPGFNLGLVVTGKPTPPALTAPQHTHTKSYGRVEKSC